MVIVTRYIKGIAMQASPFFSIMKRARQNHEMCLIRLTNRSVDSMFWKQNAVSFNSRITPISKKHYVSALYRRGV